MAGLGIGDDGRVSNASANAPSTRLIAFRAGEFAAPKGKGKKLPDRLLVCPWGEHNTNKGLVRCNATTLAVLAENQRHYKSERVALDFQHNTCRRADGKPADEPCKVAAWGDVEGVPGEGIYLSNLEWTEEGAEHARGGHYPDLSPAVYCNDRDEVIFLHSAGLVRQGEIDGLTLNLSAELEQRIMKTNALDTRSLLVGMIKACGVELPDNATDAQIEEAVAKAGEAMKKPEPKKEGDGDTGGDVLKTLGVEIGKLRDEVKALRGDKERGEREALIEKACAAGKVIPLSAEVLDTLPVTALSALVDGLPAGAVPIDRKTGKPAEPKSFGATSGEDAAAQQAVLKQLGITEDQFKKHNPAA